MTAEAQSLPEYDVIARVNGLEVRKGHLALKYGTFAPADREALKATGNPTGVVLGMEIESALLAGAFASSGPEEARQAERMREKWEREALAEGWHEAEARRRVIEELPATTELRLAFILLRARAEAEAVLAALEAGEDFLELRRTRSLTHRELPAEEAGEAPEIWWSDAAVGQAGNAALEQAVMAVAPGEAAREPFEVRDGWLLFKVMDRRPEPEERQEARRQVRREIIKIQERSAIRAAAREAAEVEVLLPALPERLPRWDEVVARVEGRPLVLSDVLPDHEHPRGGQEDADHALRRSYPELLEGAIVTAAVAALARRQGFSLDAVAALRVEFSLRQRLAEAGRRRLIAARAEALGIELDPADLDFAQERSELARAAIDELRDKAEIEVLPWKRG